MVCAQEDAQTGQDIVRPDIIRFELRERERMKKKTCRSHRIQQSVLESA